MSPPVTFLLDCRGGHWPSVTEPEGRETGKQEHLENCIRISKFAEKKDIKEK